MRLVGEDMWIGFIPAGHAVPKPRGRAVFELDGNMPQLGGYQRLLLSTIGFNLNALLRLSADIRFFTQNDKKPYPKKDKCCNKP